MAHTRTEPVCYAVSYRDHKDGSIVTLKVRSIEDSSLGLTFVALSDFIFDTASVIIDPEEESRRKKFEHIKTLHLSIYSVISIAELGPETPKLAFKNDKSNLVILQQHHNPHPPPSPE